MNTVYYHGYKLSEQASETWDWDFAEYLLKERETERISTEVCASQEVLTVLDCFQRLNMSGPKAMLQYPEILEAVMLWLLLPI